MWLWLIVSAVLVTIESLAFADGAEGLPTASQVIKAWRRRTKTRAALLTGVLIVAPIVLFLHLVLELF